LCKLWTEADIVRDRFGDELATEAMVMQTAMGSIVSKKGGKIFEGVLKKLRGR
jgi:hypothetical protein